MHEKAPMLEAKRRERLGSRYAQRERNAGKMPVVLYGHGEDPVALVVDAKETLNYIHKGEKVFRMNVGGGDQVVLLKDVQFDYLGDNIVHCDFARVDLQERIHSRVHVIFVGDAKGLKTAGALIMHPTTELEIECKVVDLPESIEVNVGELDVGDAMHASDVELPGDMKLLTDPGTIIAQIVLGGSTESAEEEEVSAEGAQPEVITEKKEDAGDD